MVVSSSVCGLSTSQCAWRGAREGEDGRRGRSVGRVTFFLVVRDTCRDHDVSECTRCCGGAVRGVGRLMAGRLGGWIIVSGEEDIGRDIDRDGVIRARRI